MVKKVQPRSTKAEILVAYKELEIAFKTLETQQEQVLTPTVASEPKNESTENATQYTHAAMDKVIQNLVAMGETFNLALSQLSTNLLVEASHLKDVRTQVDTESTHLVDLYKISIAEDTLGNLLKQYTDLSKTYQETQKQKHEECDNAWLIKNKAWQDEKEETNARLQDNDSSDKKTQKRDDTEYRYNLTLQRGLSGEEYKQQQQQQQQALDEQEETRRKTWTEHETALTQREKQFQDSKAKVDGFPNDLKAAIKKAKDEGTGIARHQAKIKTDLVTKEFIGDENVYQLKIHALEEQVKNQNSQIDKLSKQLEAAFKQAQELAVKAIEGGAHQNSFAALKEIALEQAKSQPKSK